MEYSKRKQAPPKATTPRPPATLNGADWKTSKAKLLISQDIIDGIIPLDGPYAIHSFRTPNLISFPVTERH